jgi:hypothetical protein
MNQQDKIVKEFLAQFPELNIHPSIEGDDYSDTPYSFFGVIRDILVESIENNSDLAEKISFWLDSILNNIETSNYVEDMLWIEFFEGSELDESYRTFLLSRLKNKANSLYRQYLYVMENGGLTDSESGEILKYIKDKPYVRTGKNISDIK